MQIYLQDIHHRYAIEQMLFTLYPGEKAEYVDSPPEIDGLSFYLTGDREHVVVNCELLCNGTSYPGNAVCDRNLFTNEITEDRNLQRMVKTAFYEAALRSGHEKPVWGALTGVRPGKLMSELLHSEGSPEKALYAFQEQFDVSPERASLCLDTALVTERVRSELGPKDIGLYVGIPFCPSRCDYCSFVSQSVEKSMQLIPPFLEALSQEISATAEQVKICDLHIVSIYFGGGTPTTLSAQELDTLMSDLEEKFDLSHVREYTVEAGRPDTITVEKLEVLKRHGVSRISVNPQTMSDRVLQEIGRKHSAEDVRQALKMVRQIGGLEINMDLIAGLTGDDPEGFFETLNEVLSLAPENITVHTLSRKKGSRVTKEQKKVPSPKDVAAMLDYAGEQLRKIGYEPYYLYRQKYMSGGFENVGWCKPGHENLYNICIMEELCTILALGGGGSSKLVQPGDGKNIRLMAPKYSYEYISHIDKTCRDKQKIKEFYNGISIG